MSWTQDLKFYVKSVHSHGLPSNLTNSIAGEFLFSNSHCSSLIKTEYCFFTFLKKIYEGINTFCLYVTLIRLAGWFRFTWIFLFRCILLGWWATMYWVWGRWSICLIVWSIWCRLMYIKYVSLSFFIILSKLRCTWSKICFWP